MYQSLAITVIPGLICCGMSMLLALSPMASHNILTTNVRKMGRWPLHQARKAYVGFSGPQDPEKAAKKLTDAAFTRGSNDNISCIVLSFKF